MTGLAQGKPRACDEKDHGDFDRKQGKGRLAESCGKGYAMLKRKGKGRHGCEAMRKTDNSKGRLARLVFHMMLTQIVDIYV